MMWTAERIKALQDERDEFRRLADYRADALTRCEEERRAALVERDEAWEALRETEQILTDTERERDEVQATAGRLQRALAETMDDARKIDQLYQRAASAENERDELRGACAVLQRLHSEAEAHVKRLDRELDETGERDG
jgi:chromosome segregation ATPase